MRDVPDKKNDFRFSIEFCKSDPQHIQVVDLLNGLGRRGKAQYIANAVFHYQHCVERPDISKPSDAAIIEAIVRRILQEHSGQKNHATQSDKQPAPVVKADTVDFDEAVDLLGQDGINAISGMLDMFRKK